MSRERRDARLVVRVTEGERARVARRAREAGLTASEYVRLRCLSDPTGPAVRVDAGALRALHAEMRRVGGNLNQLARAANAGRAPAPGALEGALGELSRATGEVARLLAEARRSA